MMEGFKMSENENLEKRIREKLRAKYREDMLIEEFDSPHFDRRADAIGIHLHISYSTNIEYYEIKVSRSDWLNELRQPSKSNWLAGHCDKIWLLTPDNEIAKLEEIPENWGWMYLKGQRLRVIKEAPKLNPIFDREFLIRVAQYANKEFHRLTSEEESKLQDIAEKKAKETIEATYGTPGYWERQKKIFEERCKEYESKQEVYRDILGYHDLEELKEIAVIAKVLFTIKAEQGRITEDKLFSTWNIAAIEKEIKILREATQKIASIKPTYGEPNKKGD